MSIKSARVPRSNARVIPVRESLLESRVVRIRHSVGYQKCGGGVRRLSKRKEA